MLPIDFIKYNLNKTKSFHHWLVGIFFLLYSCNQYSNHISGKDLFTGIVVVSLYVFFIQYLSKRVIKNESNAYIFATIILVITLFFVNINVMLKYFDFIYLFSRSRYILFLLIISGLGSFYFLRKNQTGYAKITRLLNILFCIYILIEAFYLFSTQNKENRELPDVQQNIKNPIANLKIDGKKPNIYFILMDAYASNRILKKHWNYENAAFTGFFRNNNFKVFDNSVSSYKTTIRTIPSILNVDYLPKSLDDLPETKEKSNILGQKISKNILIPFFEKNGYKIVNNSVFDIDKYPKNEQNYDYYEDTFMYNLYGKTIFGGTLAGIFEYILVDKNTARYHENILNNMVVTAMDSSDGGTPKFIYSHILLPHEPFILDSAGNIVRRLYTLNDQPDAYLQQLKFANKIVTATVEKLIKDTTAIIIVTGDHGYRYFMNPEINREVAFTAFTAIRLPKSCSFVQDTCPDKMSSPNIFRYVLKNGLNIPVGMLKDTSNFYY